MGSRQALLGGVASRYCGVVAVGHHQRGASSPLSARSRVGASAWRAHLASARRLAAASSAPGDVDAPAASEAKATEAAPKKKRLPRLKAGPGLNKVSATVTQPLSQGASQAMLYAVGLTPDDMSKPQVGISSVWYEGNPCNMHLLDLAEHVKKGVEEAGMVGLRFNTIGVSDGLSMGTAGMSFSLQSRDLIADSVETVMSAQWYDANVSLPGCDKNMPGTLIAMGRLNRPSLMVYGGTIRAGKCKEGKPIDIVSAFQSYGELAAGLSDRATRDDIVRNACPGPGACGGMYTANTMASAIEALGMTLPYSSSIPGESESRMRGPTLSGKGPPFSEERPTEKRSVVSQTDRARTHARVHCHSRRHPFHFVCSLIRSHARVCHALCSCSCVLADGWLISGRPPQARRVPHGGAGRLEHARAGPQAAGRDDAGCL